jgi:hypothetical protein
VYHATLGDAVIRAHRIATCEEVAERPVTCYITVAGVTTQ